MSLCKTFLHFHYISALCDCCHQFPVTESRIFVTRFEIMITKGSKLYSIFNNKCPKCQEGDFFSFSNSYDLKNFSKMDKQCQVCKLNYEPEPGYYFGAMYVSYAINVAVFVSVWVACIVLFEDINVWYQVLASVVIGLALTPLTFRWSRLSWINFFVKFDSAAKSNASDKTTSVISK